MIQLTPEFQKKFGVEAPKGTEIVKEGDRSQEMYIVCKGKLEAFKKVESGNQLVGVMKEGDFFGELSLLINEPRSATVKASDNSLVLKIPPNAFEGLIKKFPDFALDVIKGLANRLKTTTEQVVSLSEHDEDIKLLKTLIAKIESIGEKTVKGLKAKTNLDLIAKEINAKDETLIAMKDLVSKATNVISLQSSGEVLVPDLDLLKEFAQFMVLRKKFIGENGARN